MTTEEREALIVRARATQCHETCDETNHRTVDALLSALDEARLGVEQALGGGMERMAEQVEVAIVDAIGEVPDGSGCESGDEADVLAAEVRLALNRLLDERDEARGQLAALHAAAAAAAQALYEEVTRCPLCGEADRERTDDEPYHDDCELAALVLVLDDTAAAAKAHEAQVRERVERERDAAIARADAAETTLSNLRALRLGDQLDEMRAERNKAREERDTMSAALAEIARLRAAYLDAQRWALDAENMRVALSRKYGRRPYLFADYVAAKERSAALGLAAAEAEVAYEAALSALPADLAAQRDRRVRERDEALVRLAIKEAPLLRDGYLDTSVARIIATVDRKRADEAEKGGA